MTDEKNKKKRKKTTQEERQDKSDFDEVADNQERWEEEETKIEKKK